MNIDPTASLNLCTSSKLNGWRNSVLHVDNCQENDKR